MPQLGLLLEKLRFVARAVALLAVVEVGLRATSLPRMCERLGLRLVYGAQPVTDPGPSGATLTRGRVDTTARRVRKINRFWPLGETCLRQSLVTGALLRAARPTLVIGVRRRDGVVQAHAWLSVAGHAIDPEAATYSSFVFN